MRKQIYRHRSIVRFWRIVLMVVLILALFQLTACSPPSLIRGESLGCQPVPVVLLQPRPIPQWTPGGTYRDVVNLVIDYNVELRAANGQLGDIQEFQKEACL